MLQLGLNKIDNKGYHSDGNFLSSSNYKTLLKDPALFYKEFILKEKEAMTGDHLDIGSLIHSMILEPHLVATEYAFFEGLQRRGAAFDAFKLQNPDKLIMTKAQKIKCDNYIKSYNRNKVAQQLISGGESEHTICQVWNDIPTKVRCDYINVDKGYIVDVKTSGNPVDIDSVKMTLDQWQYPLSAALYTAVASQYYGKQFTFYWLFVAKKESDCQVYKMSSSTHMDGLQKCREAASIYKKCKETGIWRKDGVELLEDQFEILEV